MTDPITARTQAREAELLQRIAEQRRMANPADYVFDKAQEAFWDMEDNTLHSEKAVDASIPIAMWRVEVTEGAAPAPAEAEGAPRGRGRPPGGRARRERLIPPSKDIMRIENDQTVEGATWWPGQPKLIKDMFIDGNGFFPSRGRRIYNQYKEAPVMEHGDPNGAARWVDHVKKLWPNPKEHEYFFDYCAHMLQHPEVKCNAAIVLSGTQGIGKDAALWPVKAAIGTWNAKGIDPDELFSPYKPWLQTLMLVVDEVRPTKDEFHASSMYNILKPMIVAPPDTLPLNDKYQKLRHIINVLRVFITTNDWMAMYIPPEDRRMFIMHSNLAQRWHETAGAPGYFVELFAWFESGGVADVSAWLRARDLSLFNPKAQVVRTAGWEAVAMSWGEPEDAVTFALDKLGFPPIVFGQEMVAPQFDGRDEMGSMLKSPRKIGHRMMRAGYVAVAPPKGDRWVFYHNSARMRVRYVFVKAAAAENRDRTVAEIERHARNLMDGNGALCESTTASVPEKGAAGGGF